MATSSYIICARNLKGEAFGNNPGKLRFLRAAGGRTYSPADEVKTAEWVKEVRDLADGQADSRIGPVGDVLIFVHGYNNSIEVIARRQALLEGDLRQEGWRGVVVSFDWPSNDSTLNYWEDRSDAAKTALGLVTVGIGVLVKAQANGCETNVHLLGHSTGAFVIMEALAQAEKNGDWFREDWRIGQVAFIGGDVAAANLDADSDWAAPMFKRIMRLTNYSNGYDHVLAISNAKRLGVSPRVGRVGLTSGHHPKAVNVDCSRYFSGLDPKQQPDNLGTWAHSWHIGNRVWARDLAMTMEGRIDRNWLPTREPGDGQLHLRDGARPTHELAWLERTDVRKTRKERRT